MRVFSTSGLAMAFALATAPVLADDLARLEAATEQGGAQFSEFLLRRAPELAPNLPNWEWDDAYRAAGRCFLDRLQASTGADGVERYLKVVEDYAAKPVTSLSDTESQPSEMMSAPAVSALQSCGVQQIVMQRMIDSGLMGAMMNEATMMKLGR